MPRHDVLNHIEGAVDVAERTNLHGIGLRAKG
jgi:hypothetical protein